ATLLHGICCFSSRYEYLLYLHSFPTRRSSDLLAAMVLVNNSLIIMWSMVGPMTIVAIFPFFVLKVFSGEIDGPETNSFVAGSSRSEEHTSELQSRENLVCRLLLEKKNNKKSRH